MFRLDWSSKSTSFFFFFSILTALFRFVVWIVFSERFTVILPLSTQHFLSISWIFHLHCFEILEILGIYSIFIKVLKFLIGRFLFPKIRYVHGLLNISLHFIAIISSYCLSISLKIVFLVSSIMTVFVIFSEWYGCNLIAFDISTSVYNL